MKYLLSRASLIGGCLCFTCALFIASAYIGVGTYEVSIYQEYPVEFWLFLIFTLFFAIVSAGFSLSCRDDQYGWVAGFLLLAASNLFLIFLPYLRDYAFKSHWDDINHFSYTLNIIQTGSPHPDNFYPVSHLLVSMIQLMSGTKLRDILLLFPALFYIIYLANTAFLAWTIGRGPKVRGVMMLFATSLPYYFFGVMFYPTQFSVYMIPLFIAWLLRSRGEERGLANTIPFLLLLFFLPFLHPWAVLSVAILAFAFGLTAALTRWGNRQASLNTQIKINYWTPLITIMVTWLTWFMSFQLFGKALSRIINSFMEGIGGPEALSRYISVVERTNLEIERIASIVLHTYGANFVYAVIVIFIVARVVMSLIRRKRALNIQLVSLSLFCIVFLGLSLVSLFRDLISGNPLRFANFVAGMVPIMLIAINLDGPSGDKQRYRPTRMRSYTITLLMVLLFVAATLGIFGSYPSPFTGQANYAVSYAEEAGLVFLLNKAYAVSGNIYSPFGLSFLPSSVLGTDELNELRASSPGWWIRPAPAHLGYASLDAGVVDFEDPSFLLITAFERGYYSEVWPERGQFTEKDFELLNYDFRWNAVYTSGDLVIHKWR